MRKDICPIFNRLRIITFIPKLFNWCFWRLFIVALSFLFETCTKIACLIFYFKNFACCNMLFSFTFFLFSFIFFLQSSSVDIRSPHKGIIFAWFWFIFRDVNLIFFIGLFLGNNLWFRLQSSHFIKFILERKNFSLGLLTIFISIMMTLIDNII